MWRRRKKPLDRVVRGIVAELEASGRRLPDDRQAALTAMSEVIAGVITLAGKFEGVGLQHAIPSAEEWMGAGREAVRLVNTRRRRR